MVSWSFSCVVYLSLGSYFNIRQFCVHAKSLYNIDEQMKNIAYERSKPHRIHPFYADSVVQVDDIILPDVFRKDAIVYLRNNYNTRKNDIFVASYPKTGTSWMLNIVLQILKRQFNSNQTNLFNTIDDLNNIESWCSTIFNKCKEEEEENINPLNVIENKLNELNILYVFEQDNFDALF